VNELRDHSKPCEHGKRHTHASIPPGELIEAWCPGGREVTIDYEAFRREYFGTPVSVRDAEARLKKAFDAAEVDV